MPHLPKHLFSSAPVALAPPSHMTPLVVFKPGCGLASSCTRLHALRPPPGDYWTPRNGHPKAH